MKKKSIIAILLTLVICFALSACGGSNAGGNSETSWQEDATKEEIFECSYNHYNHLDVTTYIGIQNYIEQLTKAAPENKFTKLVTEKYGLISDDISDFESDLLNVFVMFPSEIDLTQEYKIGKIWCAGYENSEAISNERWIIAEIQGTDYDGNEYEPHYWVCKITSSDNYQELVDYSDARYGAAGIEKLLDFDISSDSGTLMVLVGMTETIAGPEYYLVDNGIVQTLHEQSNELLVLLGEYYKDIYYEAFYEYRDLEYEAWKKAKEEESKARAEYEAAKNAEPKVGMTKDEVTNGLWGEPDRKNIDEYEWGTHEQWVYEDRGYVYFEDGVVTSVSHR